MTTPAPQSKRSRSRLKKVSYVLQVQCDKIPEMNEAEFLALVRETLYNFNVRRDGSTPTVSVIKRTEEYLTTTTKEKA